MRLVTGNQRGRRGCRFVRTAAVAAAGALALSVAARKASADNGTWTSTASGNWGEPLNWNGGAIADGSGFTAGFDTVDVPFGGITVGLDSPRTIGNLTFGDTDTATAGTWLLNDNATPANVLTLSGTPTITVNPSVTANIAAGLAGTQGINKQGQGTLILSGASNVTGNVGAGVGNLSLTGSLTTTSVSVSAGGTNPIPVFSVDGGTLNVSGLSTINAGTNSGQFILNSGSATFNGGLRTSNNEGAVIRVNGGTLNVNDIFVQRNGGAANSTGVFTSGLMFMGGTVNAGTIRLGTNNSNGAMTIEGANVTATGQVTLGNQTSGDRGGHMRILSGTFTSTDTVNGFVFVQQNGTSTANQQSNATFSGGVSTVEKFAWGFNANAIGRGRLNLSGGDLYVGSGGMVQNSTNVVPTITLTSGTLGAKASWASSLPMILATGGNVTIKAADAANAPFDINLFGVVSGSGNINKTGGGTLTLSGPNTYTGSVTVAAGTLAGTTSGLRGNIANSGNVTFDQSTDGAFSGVISGAGSLTKTGSGTATLSNPQTYTGATTVSGGTLAINGAQATSGVTVQNGAALALAGNATVNALTLGSGVGDAQSLRVNTGAGINSLGVLTTNALTAHGTTTIDVGSVGVTLGDYAVLDYAGTIGGTGGGFGAFALGALPPRVTANLFNNTGNTSIDLQVTAVDVPRWTGAVNGNWDIGTLSPASGTQNWKEMSSGNPTVYLQASVPGDQVVFDDTATGTTSVNITTPVSPSLVTVNNVTKNYTFTGNKISGPTQLIKQGSGSLTLSNTGNDYAGGTDVQAGTLALGASNALPTSGNVSLTGGTLQLSGLSQDLSGAFILDGGTVTSGTVNKSGGNYDLRSGTVSADLAGAVGINKTTAGTVILTGAPTYTGATTVSEGTLQLGDGTTLGAVPGDIANSGTVTFNNNTTQTFSARIIGTTGTVVKNGTGDLWFDNVPVGGGSDGNATINSGTVILVGAVAGAGSHNARLGRGGRITINSGATVRVQQINALGLNSASLPATVTLNAGGTLHGEAGSDTALYNTTFAGGTLSGDDNPFLETRWNLRGDYVAAAGTTSNVTAPLVSMNNTPTFNTEAGATLNISSAISGASGLEKTGPGTLTLTSANNTYEQGTTVNGGTLQVRKMHGGNTVAAGATLRILESSPGSSSGHPAGDDAFVSRPSSLNVAAGATLDITNNDIIIDYTGASPVAAYEALVASGYNVSGDWQGDGIVSSIAAADGNYVVAIADNAALAAPFGTSQGGPLFAGVDVDLDTVLIKFTHRADINLDGLVTPDDSAAFGGNYDENQPAVWSTGDMNYDGIFTPDDAAIFGGAYDEALASLPEPSSLAFLALAVGAACARRRRRS